VFDYIENDQTIWEQEPLRYLTSQGQLSAYKHEGFWSALDTLRDKTHLEELWASQNPPWKRWE
jgi:glucose-1-phosphate cytidylyltransferase